MLKIIADGNTVLVPVKVVPGSSRTRLLGEWDGRVKIVVAAPREKGKANQALLACLAKWLDVRAADLTIISGQTSALKTVRVERATLRRVLASLHRAMPGSCNSSRSTDITK